MTRLSCLTVCLALALLAGNASSQVMSDTMSFNLYLQNLTFTSHSDLADNKSQNYVDLVAKVNEYLSPIGGEKENIIVSNTGDCVKISIAWRNANQTTLAMVADKLQRDGFMIWNQTSGVSFLGCSAERTLVRATVFVDFVWSENFSNHSSTEYQTLVQIVKNAFMPLGGSFQALGTAPNNDCTEMYVEWFAENATKIMDVTASLVTNGIMAFGQHHRVMTTRCAAPPAERSLVRSRLYIDLPWSENFRNQNSTEYQTILQLIKDAFAVLRGSFQALEIAQNYGCVEVYVEWNAENATQIMDVTESLKTNGIMVSGQHYKVMTTPCTAAPAQGTVLRWTFYVKMTWSENLTDHSSAEYQAVMKDVVTYFSGVGGSIRALEMAQNYGCVEFYLEWNVADATNLMELMSGLYVNGITVLNGTYAVQSQPCEIPAANVDDCPEVPKGTISTCILACASDNTSSLRQCSDGFKCCSTGCGKMCRRVGYVMSVNTIIIIDLNPVDSTDEQYDTVFSQLQAAVKTMIQRNFNVGIPNLVTDTELTDMSPYKVGNQNLTVLNVTVYLSADVSNENLKLSRDMLMNDGFTVEYGSFRVIDVRVGSNSATAPPTCGGHDCYGICKVFRPNLQYCSCYSGYMGSNCATFDCRKGMNSSTSTLGNSSLCQNGGKCLRKQSGLDYECQCSSGSTGSLCQVDLNSCPLLTPRRPGLIGLCQSACTADGDCDAEHKCCKVSCGGQACVEIGYYEKLAVDVTLDFPYMTEFNDTNSMEYQILKTQVESSISAFIRQHITRGFKSLTILRYQSSLDKKVTRRKRDVSNSVVQMELRFTESLPTESLFEIRDSLLANGFNDGDNKWTVLNIDFGADKACPDATCAAGSFCVTNFGGDSHCACPKHRSGALCDVFNCRPEGMNVCQNGGTCSYSEPDQKMFCQCPKGYSGELCQERFDMCAMGLCINGGTCQNLPGGGFHCACPEGFSGSVCENAVNHCPTGRPLMTTSGEMTCFRKPCPVGFMCNVDPLDRWTACCLKTDVLCDASPCQGGGTCVSDFSTGIMCQCPVGRKGLFCEEISNDTMVPTACQSRQRFNDWVINILKTGSSSVVTLADLRVILQHMGYKYFPTDICDEQGNFKTRTQGVLVVNPSAQRVPICMDKSGNYDSSCADAICDVLSNNGNWPFCINGGKCIGDITQKLCDCSGTGYHGIRCESTGEARDGTDCKLRQDIANMALGILNGSTSSVLGEGREASQAAVKEILSLYSTNNIFVPSCDGAGHYEYRGCLYMTADISKKNCYCALDDGTIFGTEENPWEPPQNCQKGSCPKEWGEECEKPDWWCLDKVQCKPGMERCAYFTGCTNTTCRQEAEVGCVAKGIILSCDPHPCKDDPFSICQPCGTHGSCFNVGPVNNTADMGYRCECKMGYSGPECNGIDKVCAKIPKDLCESDCVGDISHGELCKCEPGYGGIYCDKPVRSLCEKQKALYDDMIKILNGSINSYNGYTVAEMQFFVKALVQAADVESIQVLNCTEKGYYDKVQCSVSVDNLEDKECTCVDFHGNKISSNIKPYIGYDICTAPSDPQALSASSCNISANLTSGELHVCLNGGSCAFDMYAGKFCTCPAGYHGQFCQHKGDSSAFNESRSVCEFFAEAWTTAHEISTGKADWISNDTQRQLYLNLSLSVLKMENNGSYALKAECRSDGTFMSAACYYNIVTGQKGPCYCWNLRGLIIDGPPVDGADSSQCTDMKDTVCPMMKCRYISDHGYRLNNIGCRTCECKNPCEDMTCEKGQRCVIEKSMPCETEDYKLCGEAVCRSIDKPGACPDYSVDLYPAGLLDSLQNISYCNVTCYDDSDCQGEMKCCGVCGNTCVPPQETSTCKDYQTKMEAQLQFFTMAKDEYMTTRHLSRADMRILERITDIQQIWIPTCENDGYNFKPFQCEYVVDYSNTQRVISSCFCVDRWGKRIEGAKADPSDPSSCDIKPYACSAVDVYSDTVAPCANDLDCNGNEKCCGNDLNRVCQAAVDTSTLTTTVDSFMSTLCTTNADLCQGGSQCIGNWSTDGVACMCPSNRMGPFCERLTTSVTKVPRTTCERKLFALEVILEEVSNNTLNLQKRLFPTPADLKINVPTAVMYDCTADGAFEPKQYLINAFNTQTPLQAFCVYENGEEIIGTRKPVSHDQTVFCGGENMTCPRGAAYRHEHGDIQVCEGKGECADGYTCLRSTYGRYFCCPHEGEILSDCMLKQREASRSKSLKRTDVTDNDCGMTHVPSCEADGTWSREQNNPVLGVRWCVTPKGNYINNTMTRSLPQCQAVSEAMIATADLAQMDISQVDFSVCSKGQEFHCCDKTLCRQTCAAYPDAVCHINPCGGCAAEYFTSDGILVNCNKGLSLCQQEQKRAMDAVQERQINVALTKNVDIDDVVTSNGSPSRSISLSRDYPERCQLPPSTGLCRGFMPRWYFDSASGHCDMFVWGMCGGNDNRFSSPEDCYASCSPSSNPCQSSPCSSSNKVCKLTFSEDCYAFHNSCMVAYTCIDKDPTPYLVKDVYVPSCENNGEYKYKQCQGSYCWCVNSTGQYVNGLTIEQTAVLVCSENGTSQQISPADGTCPNGQKLNMSCMNACTNKVCPNHPEAICVTDLCSSSCSIKFIDEQGQQVDCTGDQCKVFSFDKPDVCTDPIPCPGMSVKTCSESICDLALKQKCSNNPCAVCKVDPCTCQPYFVDAKTCTMLTQNNCTYLTVGLCEEQTCSMLSNTEGYNCQHASLDSSVYGFPVCDTNGIYQPRQCLSSDCHCVDQFGRLAVKNEDGSCKPIDKLKRIKATFTYRADYNDLNSNNRLQALVQMLLKKLTDAGIDPAIIKNPGEPYEGSVKVDMNFEDTKDSHNRDLAMVSKKIDMMAKSGALDLIINGQNVPLTNLSQELKTESQLAAENEGEKAHSHGDGDMLTTTEKIIIGVVCGAVGLLIILIITFCMCYRHREQKKALDDSFEHVRVHDSPTLFGKPALLFPNHMYDQTENPKFVKVRL